MSDPSLASAESLPLSSERRVNDICNRFETAWRTARRPSIDDYLAETLEPERSILLRELIALDIDYRRRAGETPQGEEYRAYHEVAGVGTRQSNADRPAGACLCRE